MIRSETQILRPTVIGGQRCADDYQVIWRGMSIGRIMQSSGLPSDKTQWSWNCYVQGRPCKANESGGRSLDQCKARFSGGLGRHPGRAEDNATARGYAAASEEALARYNRKRST